MPRGKKKQIRLIIDTMVMKAIALAGFGKPDNVAMSVFQKIEKEAHTVILSHRLTKQYAAKMQEDSIPVEYFLNFFQNILEANNQIREVSDNTANKMQVHVRLPSEDVFLAQIAMASNPNNFTVIIISDEHGIYTKDRELLRKHNIRALSPFDYTSQYCRPAMYIKS
jgi:hypothetical protein